MRVLAKLIATIGICVVAVTVAPFLAIFLIIKAGVAIFRWAELHAFYDGDEARRDRAEYRLF